MIPTAERLTESEVRDLRDRVFRHVSADNNWNACGDKWMQPEEVEWLQASAIADDAMARQAKLEPI
jgi:hypothetical protein